LPGTRSRSCASIDWCRSITAFTEGGAAMASCARARAPALNPGRSPHQRGGSRRGDG
jgi:hypothetical protein